MFRVLSEDETDIDFKMLSPEPDSFNVLTYEYIHQGGRLAIVDVNDDVPIWRFILVIMEAMRVAHNFIISDFNFRSLKNRYVVRVKLYCFLLPAAALFGCQNNHEKIGNRFKLERQRQSFLDLMTHPDIKLNRLDTPK